MESARAKFLQEIVHQRFKYIASEDARAAYAKGFPFGIGNMNCTAEEREFVEARAKGRARREVGCRRGVKLAGTG